MNSALALSVVLVSTSMLVSDEASARMTNCNQVNVMVGNGGSWMPVKNALLEALGGATNEPADNGGLPTAQWVSVVDRDGNLCAVFFSGSDRQSQWPASRVISMQKANTANSLSLDGLALSTANRHRGGLAEHFPDRPESRMITREKPHRRWGFSLSYGISVDLCGDRSRGRLAGFDEVRVDGLRTKSRCCSLRRLGSS